MESRKLSWDGVISYVIKIEDRELTVRFENTAAVNEHGKSSFLRGLWTQTGLGWILEKITSEKVWI